MLFLYVSIWLMEYTYIQNYLIDYSRMVHLINI